MGAESHRVGADAHPDSPQELERLAAEIGQSRRRLDALVDELDRRRHRLLSLRRRPGIAVGAAIGALVVAGAGVLLARNRRSRAGRAQRKARYLSQAVRRIVAHPERVASDRGSPWAKVLISVAPALARALAAALSRGGTGSPRRRGPRSGHPGR